MIEEIGVVSDIQQQGNGQVVWVETQIKSTCGSCEAQSNCGTGVIAKVFAKKRETLRFEFNDMVNLGQKVKLGIPEENLLKASFLMYLIPLFVLVLSALLAQTTLPLVGLETEVWTILMTFIVTFTSFMIVKRYLNKNDNQDFHPHILSILPLENEVIEVKQL